MTQLESLVDLKTLRRFDRPGPRYTSYPTAVEFRDDVGAAEARLLLSQLPESSPVCLYTHLPFCRERCTFCACHVVATPHQPVAATYLDYLLREIDLVGEILSSSRRALQLHWGGGTPTYFRPEQLVRLFARFGEYFGLDEDAELAVEADPRVTTIEHLEALAALGFNRLSLGVQDFTPVVQAAIGRHQTFDQTQALMTHARSLGFVGGINVDLVYGLPGQTEASFRENLRQVVGLRPDRVAVYSFAYVPWLKVNQRRIDKDVLPAPETKLRLYLGALEAFLDAGYTAIGMDHFALPDDELAVAASEGRLERNFMGYTVKPAATTLAFGLSAIGDLGGGYVQNAKKLSHYYQALDRGELPVERGRLLRGDDELRRWVISRLLCGFEVDKKEVTRRFEIDFEDYFAEALSDLGDMRNEGMIEEDDRWLRVVGTGRLFVRNAAMAFDRYLRRAAPKPVFSRTI
ncbi:MAG: oxygen-independent coproporphyrinogen III oxidase [Thermoanaerobaculia bacterium]|nr:oxygen-independent coproporphyrinogen III oxidase [Thermoanaerobaculia bacterium]